LNSCPQCGQEVESADQTCVYCGYNPSTKSKQKKKENAFEEGKRIPPLGLEDEDIAFLIEKWKESYKEVPTSMKQRWILAIEPITQGWILNIVEKWARHKIGSQAEIEKNVLAVNKVCLRWAWISTAIGIEAGKGHIQDEDVPYYLMACNVPLAKHLAGYIDYLLGEKWIKEDEAEMLLGELHDIIRGNSIMLANIGSFRHSDIVAKHKEGNLSIISNALRRIDIELTK